MSVHENSLIISGEVYFETSLCLLKVTYFEETYQPLPNSCIRFATHNQDVIDIVDDDYELLHLAFLIDAVYTRPPYFRT